MHVHLAFLQAGLLGVGLAKSIKIPHLITHVSRPHSHFAARPDPRPLRNQTQRRNCQSVLSVHAKADCLRAKHLLHAKGDCLRDRPCSRWAVAIVDGAALQRAAAEPDRGRSVIAIG